jgi:hypothetical protein
LRLVAASLLLPHNVTISGTSSLSIPEPASWILGGIGLSAVGLLAYRRRRGL